MSVIAMTEPYPAGSPATSALSARHGRSVRNALPGLSDSRQHAGPGGLFGGELPPQEAHQFGELVVAHAVLEGGHIAEVARDRRCDAVQDNLDQIVRRGAVQIAVQCQRRAATEQGWPTDRMANRAGALIKPRAGGRG